MLTLKIGFSNRVILVIPVVLNLRVTTLSISGSTGELVLKESEIVSVASLSEMEISKTTELKMDFQSLDTLKVISF